MCGIYLTNQPLQVNEVKKRVEKIQFRGPDNTDVIKTDQVILAHLRLSILDLDKRSNQPMRRNNLILVFNGEIYNYKDLKEELLTKGYEFNSTSDSEVLLVGYMEWKEDVVNKINGMFSFCIYDIENHFIFGARDRLGVKPFYYYWNDGEFEICSQLAPMSKDKEISKKALSIYYDCGYIPSPYSIYENVFKLQPGNCIKIDLANKSKTTWGYWDLQKIKVKKITYLEAKRQLHDLLIDAVKIRLNSDVAIGSFLSGGIDSALVSSIAAKISKDQIKTFCIGFEDPKYDERKTAQNFANIIDSSHLETICTPEQLIELIPKLIEVFDEPFADSSALPSLLLNKVTKKNITVALSGDGGDESFLGYNHFRWVEISNLVFKTPLFIRKFISLFIFQIPKLIGRKRVLFLKKILKFKNQQEFIFSIFKGFSSLQSVPFNNWHLNYNKYQQLSDNAIQKTADLGIKLWLENDSNVKVDRASMAYSVEVRSPFLDYRIIEFARKLPIHYKYKNSVRKRILKDILKEYIPESVFNQPKKGFSIPIGKWMKNELKDEFISHLTDDFLKKLPNFKMVEFKKMLNSHMNGKEDYSYYIWRIYVLSKWWKSNNL